MDSILGSVLGGGNRLRKAVKRALLDPMSILRESNETIAHVNIGQRAAAFRDIANANGIELARQQFPDMANWDPQFIAQRAAEYDDELIGAAVGSIVPGGKVPARSKVRVGTTGQYVGAPPGVDSPQKFGAIVSDYQRAMQEGLPGRHFYTDSSKDIWARVGHDPVEADRVAQNLAALSRANNVGGNTTMSVLGHTQAVTGTPVRTGRFPSRDSAPVQAIYDESAQALGLKRDPFATQLGVEWNPGRIGRGVNDMHEAELMGYPSGTVGGPTQHAFMDDVRARAISLANEKKLGGVEGWNTGNAQAAAWTANKIRRGDLTPGDAAKTYADYMPLHEANATYEAIPGAGTGHLQGLLDAPWDVRMRFTQSPAGSWNTSASGRDIGYTAARLLPGETVEAAGRFEGGSNPAFVARPVVGSKATSGTTRSVTDESTSALNAVEAARAYFDVQNAGAAHKLMASKLGEANSARLNFGRTLSGEEMAAIAPHFERAGFDIATDPSGITLVPRWGDNGDITSPVGEKLGETVKSVLKANKLQAKPEWGQFNGTYVDYSQLWPQGKGAVTNKLLGELEKAPTTMGLLESSVPYRDAVLARTTRDLEAQSAGLGVAREDVMRAREIFAREGWEGLRRAAQQGLVPAFLLGAGLQGFADSPTER